MEEPEALHTQWHFFPQINNNSGKKHSSSGPVGRAIHWLVYSQGECHPWGTMEWRQQSSTTHSAFYSVNLTLDSVGPAP